MELKGEPKFALQNCEVGCSVLVEKMHTPGTKKYHFSKKSPAVGDYLVISRITCLLLGSGTISYDFHLDKADIILLGTRILVQFFGLRVGDRKVSDYGEG